MDITQQTTPSGARGPKPPGMAASGRTQRSNGDRRTKAGRLAGGLGWFSVGLGLAEVLAPGEVARMVGVRNDRRTRGALTAIGVRELANGLGILAAQRRSRWLWLRVGGDLVDLGLLGAMMTSARRRDGRMAAAFTALTALTMLDALAARTTARPQGEGRRSTQRRALPGIATRARATRTVTATVTIRRPVDEVYRFWRQLENLPHFMAHLDSIEAIDEQRSHWRVHGPAGITLEWDAEIVEDRPGESISWRSVPGADIDNRGTVRFVAAPGDRGTEVHACITYAAPGGRVGAMIAKLFGREPGQQARGDLRRLKQVLETGEVVHSDASIHRLPHAARPPTRRFLERRERERLGAASDQGRGHETPAYAPEQAAHGSFREAMR